MKIDVSYSIWFTLVSLFCCHGLADEIILKGGQIEEHSNFAIIYQKLKATVYPISFFETINYKFLIDESAVAPLVHYNTLVQRPTPTAAKRIIRQANTADDLLANTNISESPHVSNNTMNSTAENSNGTQSILHSIKTALNQYIAMKMKSKGHPIINLNEFYNWAPYVTVKKYYTEIIDSMLNGVSIGTSYILMIKNYCTELIDYMVNGVFERESYKMFKQHKDAIQIIGWSGLLGVFFGILMFVAVRSYRFRNANRELNQQPENILMCLV